MNIKFENIPEFKQKKIDLPDAPFLSYKPDFAMLRRLWQEFGAFKNILLIGHGGSITSFIGMHAAFASNPNFHTKNLFVLSSVDPEYLLKLKKDLPKHDTLVIAISKSGETVTQIEALMHFLDFPLLFITGKGSTLEQIGNKVNAKIVLHPDIGGRYTAFTEVGLVPAAICGFDVEKIYTGALSMYDHYKNENIALKAAQVFAALEEKGFVDVFMPFYSHNLFPFNFLIVQLCHESFGKHGLGQTYFAAEAPESQHHTNQRFFGGRKNVAGFFTHLENFREDVETIVPTSMHSIPIKDGHLFQLHKTPLSVSMQAEFAGTFEDAKMNNIPLAVLSLDSINEREIGAFIAFWQMYAVYSSVLREVNPFDQPQVESSKIISWKERKAYKM